MMNLYELFLFDKCTGEPIKSFLVSGFSFDFNLLFAFTVQEVPDPKNIDFLLDPSKWSIRVNLFYFDIKISYLGAQSEDEDDVL